MAGYSVVTDECVRYNVASDGCVGDGCGGELVCGGRWVCGGGWMCGGDG